MDRLLNDCVRAGQINRRRLLAVLAAGSALTWVGLGRDTTRRAGAAQEESAMSDLKTLMTGLVFPESPRWHEDRLWVADWGAQELIAVDLRGESEVIASVPSFPFSID
jgi:hypothetical protein